MHDNSYYVLLITYYNLHVVNYQLHLIYICQTLNANMKKAVLILLHELELVLVVQL